MSFEQFVQKVGDLSVRSFVECLLNMPGEDLLCIVVSTGILAVFLCPPGEDR